MADPLEAANPDPARRPNELRDLILFQSSKLVNEFWTEHQLATTTYRQKLLKWYKQYRGIPGRKNYDGLANVFVNETLEATEAIVAQEFHSVNAEAKPVLVVGREETDNVQASIIEKTMIAYLDKMNYKSKFIRALRQRAKYGTCYAKVCWEYESGTVYGRDKMGAETSDKKPIKDKADLQYIDGLDIAVDPGISDIENMAIVVIRKRCTWDYVKDRERRTLYSSDQVAKIERKGSSSLFFGRNQRMQAAGVNNAFFDKDEIEILEAWGKFPRWWLDDDVSPDSPEAEELVPGLIECVCSESGPTLRVERNPYWHQEIPVLMCQYIECDGEANGIGVCEISEYLQQELNDKRNQLLDHATLQIFPMLAVNRAAGINQEQIKFKPSQRVLVDGDPEKAIVPIRIGGNPGEIQAMDQTIKQDIRNQTGATSPVQGVSSNKESTAFEVSTLLNRGSMRISMSTVEFSEKFLRRFYRLLYKLIQQYVDKETVVRIVGKEGIKWQKVTPADLAIDADIVPRVAIDLDSRTILRSQLIQFVSSVGQMYPRINIYNIVRKVYDLFGFDDGDSVVPEPDTERGQNDLSMEEEIQVLLLGQNIDVKYYDNHVQKISALMGFVQQYGKSIDPKAVEAIQNKIGQHANYLRVLQEAQALAGQAAAPPTPGGQPNGFEHTENQTTETPVSASAQMKRDMTRV